MILLEEGILYQTSQKYYIKQVENIMILNKIQHKKSFSYTNSFHPSAHESLKSLKTEFNGKRKRQQTKNKHK